MTGLKTGNEQADAESAVEAGREKGPKAWVEPAMKAWAEAVVEAAVEAVVEAAVEAAAVHGPGGTHAWDRQQSHRTEHDREQDIPHGAPLL
jgi:hypothetical protein